MNYYNTTNTFKKYQVLKIGSHIKTNTFLFFFLSNKSKSSGWKKIEQILKKLELVYCKIINKVLLKKLKNSIFRNFSVLIGGTILLLAPVKKQLKQFKVIEKTLQFNFSLLCLKLNNKMYSINEVKKLYDFSYKKNVFFLQKSLEKYLKLSHISTAGSKKSK